MANLLKGNIIIKKITLFFGKNSLDFLLGHVFFIWFILYIWGAWYPTLSGVNIPLEDANKCLAHLAGAFSLTLILNCGIIAIKEKL